MPYMTYEDDDRTVRLLLQRRHTWSRYGNRKVFCKGAIMVGPIRSWWWLLEIWTIVVGCLFLSEYAEYHFGVVLFGAILFVLCVASCVAIDFGDPGVLVKPTFEDAYRNAKEVSQMVKSGVHNPYKNVTVGNKVYKYSYCMRCHHFRPPETGHCYTCDSCIEHWDHHCPVFGGCGGRKNIIAFHVMCLSEAVIWTFWLVVSAFATTNALRDSPPLEVAVYRSKTLIGVVIGFAGAAVLPVILSKTRFEKNMCEHKPKAHHSIHDYNGDWSTGDIPDPPATTGNSVPLLKEPTSDCSEDEKNDSSVDLQVGDYGRTLKTA